ncbi:MAG: aminoglycoside phosphotransferase, partial [Riemerella sp.]
MHLSTAKTFFEEFIGSPAADFQVLQQSGSSRINF